MNIIYAAGFLFSIPQILSADNFSHAPDDSGKFYGEWLVIDSRQIADNGDILPERDEDIIGERISVQSDGVLLPGGYSFSFTLKQCRDVRFEPRMWNDFGYMRLAKYDLQLIFNLFGLNYSYDSLVYRIRCADRNLDSSINYPIYDAINGGDRPDNKNIPFDGVNFIHVDSGRFVLYNGDDWILLKRLR